jgi:lipopolysaccharide/colanic/teichoic acid biosynthesis glycosyltransferase
MGDQISATSRKAAGDASDSCKSGRVYPVRRWYLPIKRILDYVGAVLLAILLLPVVLLAVILVKLTSRGPAFYVQTRVGKNGRIFSLFKLRTMVHNAEALTGPVWATSNDSRVTTVGRYLRDLHIDEFPQLLNVLAGHMSLVGPRPERPEFVSRLEWLVPDYCERLNLHPGISGLAQLKLPPDSDIDSVRRKLVHDLYYIRHLSPWLDAKLLLFTAGLLLTKLARRIGTFFSLPTNEEIEQPSRSGAPAECASTTIVNGAVTSCQDPAASQA